MIIFFAKSSLINMDTAQKPGIDFNSLQHTSGCRKLSFDRLEVMENPFSTEYEDVDQSTTASNRKRVIEQVTTFTLTKDSNATFSE